MAPDISDVSKDTQSLHGHEVIPPTGLAVRDLGKTFKGRPVLRDVNLAVQRGEAVGLLGPNGAGYRCIAAHV